MENWESLISARMAAHGAVKTCRKIFIAPPYLDKREKHSTEKGTENAERT